VSDILNDKHELRRFILRTTPLWKALLFAKYGNTSLLNEIQKETPKEIVLRLVKPLPNP